MKHNRLLVVLCLLLLICVPLSFAADGDYKIPEATEHIEILDDGACIITEDIVYDIEGSVNGVYRDIPVDSMQSVTNVSVSTPGYYNDYEVIKRYKTSNDIRIKVWLYKDKEKTQKVSNQEVPVTFKYTFNNGVKIYNDIAEFQYMSWGKYWESDVATLTTYIKIPGSSQQTEYWNNPDTHIKTSDWNSEDVLVTVANDIPEKTSLEQRILMPKSYFKSTDNANVINKDAKAQIEADQKKYAEDLFYQNTIPQVLLTLMGILMILPAGIYYLYGREPKTDYYAEYEYDLPTNSKPVEVNSIVIGDVGEINFYAFNSVILDLINRKYFRIIMANPDNIILKMTDKSYEGLEEYEVDLINYLRKFENNEGVIALADIKQQESPSGHVKFMDEWTSKAKKSVPDSLLNRYFDKKGLGILKKYSIILLIMSVVTMIVYIFGDWQMATANNPYLTYIFVLIPLIAIIEVIFLYGMKNTTFGRWTKEGKEYHDKWKNFEKYIKDYSLINERPPESVQIWGRYLVYAAALGYARSASNAMQQYFNNNNVSYESIVDNNAIYFAYYGGFHQMDESFSTLRDEYYSSTSGSDFNDIGSAGSGGFGGGGGGTF